MLLQAAAAPAVAEVAGPIPQQLELRALLNDYNIFLIGESSNLSHCRALKQVNARSRVCASSYGTPLVACVRPGEQLEVWENLDATNMVNYNRPGPALPFPKEGERWALWFQGPYSTQAPPPQLTAMMLRQFVDQAAQMLRPRDRVLIGWAKNYEDGVVRHPRNGPIYEGMYGINQLITHAEGNGWQVVETHNSRLVAELINNGYRHMTNTEGTLCESMEPIWKTLILEKR